MNETILKRIGALLSVKSIVTLLLSGVFAPVILYMKNTIYFKKNCVG